MQYSEFRYFHFTPAGKDELSQYTVVREGETKLGEKIWTDKSSTTCKFLILGIEESIGPQANSGEPGAEFGFSTFLKRFLNMQSNRFLDGDEIVYIGRIQADKNSIAPSDLKEARRKVEELDNFVESILSLYCSETNIIPIVIGGGHNNAFPILKFLSKKLQSPINVINLDPHADCRALEGRHSGNSFSYAKSNDFLDKYTVLGLHKPYNSESILKYLDEQDFAYTFFEDYLNDSKKFILDLNSFTEQTIRKKIEVGLELDMDSIQFMPTSAFTPSGFTLENARTFIRELASKINCCYLHLPEGAPRNSGEEKIVGKALAYLVWDFISEQNKKN